jgi:hypothetical protein
MDAANGQKLLMATISYCPNDATPLYQLQLYSKFLAMEAVPAQTTWLDVPHEASIYSQ